VLPINTFTLLGLLLYLLQDYYVLCKGSMNTRLTSFKARCHQFPMFDTSPQYLTGTCLGSFKMLLEALNPLVSQDMLPVPSEKIYFLQFILFRTLKLLHHVVQVFDKCYYVCFCHMRHNNKPYGRGLFCYRNLPAKLSGQFFTDFFWLWY
jgi:hypothetical protein